MDNMEAAEILLSVFSIYSSDHHIGKETSIAFVMAIQALKENGD